MSGGQDGVGNPGDEVMPYSLTTPRNVIGLCSSLEGEWRPRRTQVRKWYNLIRLVNDLAQPNLESVISTDPRSGFQHGRLATEA